MSILSQGQMRLRMTCSLSVVQVLWHCDVGDGHAGSSAVSGTVQRRGGQVCQRGSLHGGAPEVSTQSVSHLGTLESCVCLVCSSPVNHCVDGVEKVQLCKTYAPIAMGNVRNIFSAMLKRFSLFPFFLSQTNSFSSFML